MIAVFGSPCVQEPVPVREVMRPVLSPTAVCQRAPFPFFGGKHDIADVIWERFGPVRHYLEPFAGSLAVLLTRPHPPQIETVNDLDGFITNVWRALAQDPRAVAQYADRPVNEIDMHAANRWLGGTARDADGAVACRPPLLRCGSCRALDLGQIVLDWLRLVHAWRRGPRQTSAPQQ